MPHRHIDRLVGWQSPRPELLDLPNNWQTGDLRSQVYQGNPNLLRWARLPFSDRAVPNNLVRPDDDPVFTQYLASNKVASMNERDESRESMLRGVGHVKREGFENASHWWLASVSLTCLGRC